MASKTGPSEGVPPTGPDAVIRDAAARLVDDLSSRRWFGAKTRTVARVTPLDYAAVTPAGDVLATFRVEFAGGPPETYCIPVRAQGAEPHDPSVWDALDDAAFCSALVEQIRVGGVLHGRYGSFHFRATAALAELFSELPTPVNRVKTEQSNTSVVFGGKAILKVFRKLEPGPNPDLEITDFLTRHTGFRAAPRLLGAIEYQVDGEEPTTVATLHEYIANDGDAWTAVQARLGEYFAVAVTGLEPGRSPDPAAARALAAVDAKEARMLGELTGALHTALAGSTEPALSPERIDGEDVRIWQERMKSRLDRASDALAAALATLPGDVRELAQRAMDGAPALGEAFASLDALTAERVMKIRIHGDYHLGQVLRADGGFVIVDFEGEPARPLSERRARECALRDVAGMLRSFGYALRAAMLRAAEVAGDDPGLTERLAPWATAWEDGVRRAFMDGYLAQTQERGAAFLPRHRGTLDAVLRAFELDKVNYEIAYEVNHRPSWVRIPLEALPRAAAPPAAPAPSAARATKATFRFVACLELREFVGARAEDERQLADLIEQAPLDSIYYHTHAFFLRHKFLAGIYPNDFATWVAVHVRDQVLGERLAMVDPAEFEGLDTLRDELVAVIDDHLRQLAIVPRIASAEPFDFIRSRIVEIPTGFEVRTLDEFRQALLEVDSSAIYVHVVEARARLGRGRTTSRHGSSTGSASHSWRAGSVRSIRTAAASSGRAPACYSSARRRWRTGRRDDCTASRGVPRASRRAEISICS